MRTYWPTLLRLLQLLRAGLHVTILRLDLKLVPVAKVGQEDKTDKRKSRGVLRFGNNSDRSLVPLVIVSVILDLLSSARGAQVLVAVFLLPSVMRLAVPLPFRVRTHLGVNVPEEALEGALQEVVNVFQSLLVLVHLRVFIPLLRSSQTLAVLNNLLLGPLFLFLTMVTL